MGASGERCPQCGEPVGRFDYQCPECELVLPEREAPRPRDRREVSVVRAIMERPRSRTEPGRPKKVAPPRPTVTGPNPQLVPLDRVLHVRAALRLQSLNLHPYEAWVVSLIDGQSTGQMLSEKLELAPRELQGLLQGLIDRGAVSLGEVRPGRPGKKPSERAKTVSLPDAEQPSDPTQLHDREALLEAATDPQIERPQPRPPQPEGRRATGPSQKPLAGKSGAHPAVGSDGDEDESTAGMGRHGQPARKPDPQRAEPTVMLPMPEAPVQRREAETILEQRAEPTVIFDKRPAPVAARAEPETIMQPRPSAGGTARPTSARPVSSGARPVSSGARPVSGGARPVSGGARPISRPNEAMRPMSDPYRPPMPASAKREVPRPTMGIDDVDAQGALQVALQMEQSGRMEDAVGYLERAIARSPDAAPLYNRLAVILMRDFDDLSTAEQLVLRALELVPSHPVFTRNLNTIRQKLRGAKGKRR